MGVPLLTNVESVRQFLQQSSKLVAEEEDIEILCIQVSEAIPRYCNREFGPTAGDKRRFEFLPGCSPLSTRANPVVVNVTPYELRTVTKATLDPEVSGGTDLTTGQWRLWPLPARDGTYYGLRLGRELPVRPGASQEFPTRQLDITGDWGMAEVPDIIRHYANVTIEAWLHMNRDPGVGFNALADGEAPPMHPADLPSGVRWALDKTWKRPVFPAVR